MAVPPRKGLARPGRTGLETVEQGEDGDVHRVRRIARPIFEQLVEHLGELTAQADQSGRAHPQRRVGELAGPGALLLAVGRLCVPVMPAPLLPGGPAAVFAGLFVLGPGTPTPRVMIDILVFRRVADELRGRVIAATMTLFTVGMPAGTLGSGLLLDHLSPTAALAAIAGLLAVALPPATVGRTLRRSTWPEAARPDTAA